MVNEHNISLKDLIKCGMLQVGTQVTYNYRGTQYLGAVSEAGITSNGELFVNPTHWSRSISGNNCSGWGSIKLSGSNVPLVSLKREYINKFGDNPPPHTATSRISSIHRAGSPLSSPVKEKTAENSVSVEPSKKLNLNFSKNEKQLSSAPTSSNNPHTTSPKKAVKTNNSPTSTPLSTPLGAQPPLYTAATVGYPALSGTAPVDCSSFYQNPPQIIYYPSLGNYYLGSAQSSPYTTTPTSTSTPPPPSSLHYPHTHSPSLVVSSSNSSPVISSDSPLAEHYTTDNEEEYEESSLTFYPPQPTHHHLPLLPEMSNTTPPTPTASAGTVSIQHLNNSQNISPVLSPTFYPVNQFPQFPVAYNGMYTQSLIPFGYPTQTYSAPQQQQQQQQQTPIYFNSSSLPMFFNNSANSPPTTPAFNNTNNTAASPKNGLHMTHPLPPQHIPLYTAPNRPVSTGSDSLHTTIDTNNNNNNTNGSNNNNTIFASQHIYITPPQTGAPQQYANGVYFTQPQPQPQQSALHSMYSKDSSNNNCSSSLYSNTTGNSYAYSPHNTPSVSHQQPYVATTPPPPTPQPFIPQPEQHLQLPSRSNTPSPVYLTPATQQQQQVPNSDPNTPVTTPPLVLTDKKRKIAEIETPEQQPHKSSSAHSKKKIKVADKESESTSSTIISGLDGTSPFGGFINEPDLSCVALQNGYTLLSNEELSYHQSHTVRIPYLNSSVWSESCRICGGLDEEGILYCIDCGQSYHTYCLNIKVPEANMDYIETWRCPSCRICEICLNGFDAITNSVSCHNCNQWYHYHCLQNSEPHPTSANNNNNSKSNCSALGQLKQCACYQRMEELRLKDKLKKESAGEEEPDDILLDDRECCFCKRVGDQKELAGAHLIPYSLDKWVHYYCLLYSSISLKSDVSKGYCGMREVIVNNSDALEARYRKSKCSKCSKFNASVECSICPLMAHYPCVAKDWSLSYTFNEQSNTFSTLNYCKIHKPKPNNQQKQQITPAAKPPPPLIFTRDCIIDLKSLKGTITVSRTSVPLYTILDRPPGISFHYRVKLGSLRIESIGEINFDNPAFWSESTIFPINYIAIRKYWSVFAVDERIDYLCKIEMDKKTQTPLFSIQVLSNTESVFLLNMGNHSLHELGREFIAKIRELRKEMPQIAHPVRFAIKEFFGLEDPYVVSMIESIPYSKLCTGYRRRYVDLEPKGCARSLEYSKYKSMKASASAEVKKARGPPPPRNQRSYSSSSSLFEFEKSIIDCARKYNDLVTQRMPRIYVKMSSIHSCGAFARRDIKNGEFIIEYIGEVIRQKVADKREKEYQDQGIDCFMFRIDNDNIIDATLKGNRARMINHSCDPNSKTAIITTPQQIKKIVVIAIKDIMKDEEVVYNYCFPKETDPQLRLKCRCNSQNCKGYLN